MTQHGNVTTRHAERTPCNKHHNTRTPNRGQHRGFRVASQAFLRVQRLVIISMTGVQRLTRWRTFSSHVNTLSLYGTM